MAEHELKTDPAAFDAIAAGLKTHEIRFNDRNYAVGDILVLRKTVATGRAMSLGVPLEYIGEPLRMVVTHIQYGYGLGPGWVVLSIKREPVGPGIFTDDAAVRARARYEFVRTLSPSAFFDLWKESLQGRQSFDSLVDAAIVAQALVHA